MLISIVGTGYVGLVTAACLAKLGNEVRCFDINRDRVAGLRGGHVPIREPGLDELVDAGRLSGRLSFHAERHALRGTVLAIVAVGTLDGDDQWTDSAVRAAVRDLAADRSLPRSIVIRSTLLPGTAVSIAREIDDVDPDVQLALNPEFTREGSAVNDFLEPDRVVIGVRDPAQPSVLVQQLRHLYEPLDAPLVVTDLTSAETIKVGSNVFLATKIAFANELARLCAATGADVHAVVDGIGLDRRIGRAFLSPGPGFGGSCLPSQARALPRVAAAHHVATPVMSAVSPSNEAQADWLVERAEEALGGLAGRRATLLGLTFKAGTDDLRESPALRLARLLAGRGATVAAYDPSGTADAAADLATAGVEVTPSGSVVDAARDADVIVVATEWPEFRELDWEELAGVTRGRLVVDARHVVNATAAGAAGFEVLELGRPAKAHGRSSILLAGAVAAEAGLPGRR